MPVTVQEISPSKSGKSLRVKLSGKWYGAAKDCGIEAHKGKEIEAAISTTEWGPWLDGYKPVGSASPVQSASTPVPSGPSYIAEPQQQVNPNMSEAELRFVSNVVGQGILAKTITEPGQITVWAKAAKQALKDLI